MTATIDAPDRQATRADAKPPREVIYRHTVLVRLTHWLNALVIVVMIGSGLNIFNAHPRLYWGLKGDEYDRPWLSIAATESANGARGITTIGSWRFDTSGFLGVAREKGQDVVKAWPSILTIPSNQDLADARHWHFLFAWILAANGLVYLIWGVVSRHLKRDIVPTVDDLRDIPRSVIDHVQLKHPVGEAAKRYNVLQRLAYLGVITLISLMVLTGLTMSPGFNAFAPWLLDLFGGRQSARSLHFLCASGLVAFIAIHLTEVVLAGPYNEIKSMITGRYAVPSGHSHEGAGK
jgi:thiosulfate reductase cytochrome b subunit